MSPAEEECGQCASRRELCIAAKAVLAAIVLGALVWGPLLFLAPAGNERLALLIVVLGQQAACLGVGLLVARKPIAGRSQPILSRNGSRSRACLLGGFGVLLLVGLGLVYDECLRRLAIPGAPTLGPWGATRAAPVWAAGLIVAAGVGVTPLADELFYRAYLFRLGVDAGAPWLAALGSSLLFTLSRLDGINFPAYFGLGLLLCAVYRRTGSLLGPWTMHVLLNAVMFLLLFGGYS